MKQKLCKVTMIFSILVTTILFGISVSANDNITNIEDIKGHGTSYDKIYIDENYRGLGIGKNLFESLLYYMKEQNIQQFYLFTDTSCNYGFYEHQGMRREHEKSLTMDIANQKQVMKFFIYSYQI